MRSRSFAITTKYLKAPCYTFIMKKDRIRGFTLVEMLVVVTIIGILATVLYANFGEGSAQSRDAKRKADLRLVQNALELYKQENGRYPAGCNGANGDAWSGEQGADSDSDGTNDGAYKCAGSDTQYIVGLAPKYIPVLPKDPKKGSGDYGYVYLTNAEGTVYKFVARNTVESETVGNDHLFNSCEYIADVTDSDGDGNDTTVLCSLTDIPSEWAGKCGLGKCNMVNINGACTVAAANYKRYLDPSFLDCHPNNIEKSYAVWGGYANDTDPKKVECYTEKVICDMPPLSGIQ